jgi:hypothetical protein
VVRHILTHLLVGRKVYAAYLSLVKRAQISRLVLGVGAENAFDEFELHFKSYVRVYSLFMQEVVMSFLKVCECEIILTKFRSRKQDFWSSMEL